MAGAAILLGLVLLQPDKSWSQASDRRSLDTKPRVTLASPALPDGEVIASFELDTGKDQMTLSRRRPRLEFVVRLLQQSIRQTIATCAQPSLGTALGGGTERELEVAFCDGEFWLIAEPGRIFVERKSPTGPAVVASVTLPWPDVRARRPAAAGAGSRP